MYPVRLGFKTAKKRIRNLIQNGHNAEALLTSVFTFEKIIHRTLKQLMVSAGFRNKDAKKILEQVKGFKNQKEIWSCFDPQGRNLPAVIGNKHWQHVNSAITMRNQIVHGARVYDLAECKAMAENIIDLLDQTVSAFNSEYGFDGWSKVAIRRISKLHTNPKVKKSV